MKIKFVDLAAQNLEIGERVARELDLIHSTAAYVGGDQVESFEREFAEFLKIKHVIGVANGTDALRIALLALGVGPGHEVITVPMTFIATAAAIVQTGARPRFVDIDPATGNISLAALRSFLESMPAGERRAIRAIVPVHLYGLPAPMVELREIAAEFNLKVVEDACQAHGARIRTGAGMAMAGTLGDAGCFSFYPAKNLGAWGDGGAVVTNDDELAQRARLLSNHGRLSHYAHEICGYNSRLDSIQAAVLRAKLEKLREWNERRRVIASAYRELLAPLDARSIVEPDGLESCFHLFVVRSARRDALRNALLQNDIECGIHYPVPLHLQPALFHLGYRPGDFPASEALADTTLSLPMHPHLDGQEILRTIETLAAALTPEKESHAFGRSAASSSEETATEA